MDQGFNCELLAEPWRSRATSILHGIEDGLSMTWEHCEIICGTFWNQIEDSFDISLHPFVRGKGFCFDCQAAETKVVVHDAAKRSLNLNAGDGCIFSGPLRRLTDGSWVGDSSVTITKRTLVDPQDAVECFHFFAGAFSGWGQALSTIPMIWPHATVGTQTFLDLDPNVADALAFKHGSKKVIAPLQARQVFEVTLNRVIQADVADFSILHAVQPTSNMVYKASPPCISWSKGGYGKGLSCPEGWAFLDLVLQCARGQPILLAVECVDELPRHPHFKLIQSLLRSIGFISLWEDVSHYHSFVHMVRSRWLAVFVRQDVYHVGDRPAPVLRSQHIDRWTSDCFRFDLPTRLASRLSVSHSVRPAYAQHSLLPPAKRSKIAPNAPAEVILQTRFLRPHEPVPTVCASYGFQHLLPIHLLEQKGIFATLKEGEAGPEFLDPAMLASMLGLFETTVLSNQLQLLYRQIGNAIASPQALLALLTGLSHVFHWKVNINDAITQAWGQRIAGPKAVIIEQDNFYIFARVGDIIDQINIHSDLDSGTNMRLRCTHVNGRISAISAQAQWQLADLLRCFSWKFDIASHVYLAATGEKLHPWQHLDDLFAQCDRWTLFAKGYPIVYLTILGHQALDEATQRWQADDLPVPLPALASAPCCLRLLSDDELFEDQHFQFALSYIEHHCLAMSPDAAPTFTIAFGPLPCTVALCGLSSQQDRQLCLHEFWDHLDQGLHQYAFKLIETIDGDLPVPFGVIFHKHTEDKLVLVRFGTDRDLCGFYAPSWIYSLEFKLGTGSYRLLTCNGQSIEQMPFHLDHGDFLHLSLKDEIHCGGHHGSRTTTLPANANLLQRAEFASNTGGWLASDEMAFFLRQLTWLAPEFAIFHPAVRWNLETANLDENDYQEILIANNRLNVLPILSGSHWLAFEIQREGPDTHVTFVGLPGPLLRSGLQVVARLLDVSPDRLQYSHVPLDDAAHFCGWALLHRWAMAAGVLENLPLNSELYASTSIAVRALIDDVIEDAIEDWNQSGIAHGLWFFAAALRRAFFSFLATTTLRGNAVTQEAIVVTFDDIPNTADQLETPSIHIDSPDSHLHHRIQHFNHYPGWLGSDELDFILQAIRFQRPLTCFMPPARWDHTTGHFVYFDAHWRDFRAYNNVTWFLLVDQCWTQIDAAINADTIALYMSLPDAMAHLAGPIATFIMTQIDEAQLTCQVHIVRCNPEPNMCGWVLLHSLCERLRIAIPPLANEVQHTINLSRFRVQIRSTIERARMVWQLSSSFPRIINFASLVRTIFLHHLLADRGALQYAAGGGTETGNSTAKPGGTSSKVDLLQIDDPWASKTAKTKPSKKLFQTRWEDLTMPSDHPLLDEKGASVPQVHRLQAGAKKAGAILATKSAISELARITPCATMVVVLPGNDKNQYSELGLKVIGPYELVLEDGHAKTAYKRLVILWQLHGVVTYKLPDPKVQLTATEVAELVMDADSRLIGPQLSEQAQQQQIHFLKHQFGLIHPDCVDKINMYAFRIGKHPTSGKDDKNFQCIIKLPVSSRKDVLRSSGTANFLFRDYLTAADAFEDNTVLPRFWEPKASAVHEVLIMTKGINGFAGLCLTRRGLAARAWTSHVAEMRKAILSGDPRITAENISVIPKITYQTTGWPASTEPRDVITATLKATGLPPLPSRAFRSNGVCGWTLAFQKRPAIAKFSVEVNGKLHEILLVEDVGPAPTRPPARQGAKRTADSSKLGTRPEPAPPSQFSPDAARLDRLEEKFNVLEGRQSRMETKFDSRFDDISSSLRQLLQAANAPRERSPSGETPAPKHSRGPGPY